MDYLHTLSGIGKICWSLFDPKNKFRARQTLALFSHPKDMSVVAMAWESVEGCDESKYPAVTTIKRTGV